MTRARDREVDPCVLLPEDPTAGDELLHEPADLANARAFGGVDDEAAFWEADRAFHARWLEMCAGRRPFDVGAFADLAAPLALPWHPERGVPPWPFKHDTRPPRELAVPVEDELLAAAVEDFAPDAAMMVERVLGWDPAAPPGAAPPLGALAALAFVGVAQDGRRPLDFWQDEERDLELAASARALDLWPPCLWIDGRPALPLSPRHRPDEGPGGAFVARAYRCGGRWCWSGTVRLRAAPDVRVLEARLLVEWLRYRRHERRASWEDLLRARPELLYRAASEGAARAAAGSGPSGSG